MITSGKYGGIGVTIGLRDEHLTITSLMDGYSAQKQGLQPGDRILEIDGKSLVGLKPGDVRPLTRGEPGTELHMKVERDGKPEPILLQALQDTLSLRRAAAAEALSGVSGAELRASLRKMLQDPLIKALGAITREKWSTSKEWEIWWRKNGSTFAVEK